MVHDPIYSPALQVDANTVPQVEDPSRGGKYEVQKILLMADTNYLDNGASTERGWDCLMAARGRLLRSVGLLCRHTRVGYNR